MVEGEIVFLADDSMATCSLECQLHRLFCHKVVCNTKSLLQ